MVYHFFRFSSQKKTENCHHYLFIQEYLGFKQDENNNVPLTCKLCLKKVCPAVGNTSKLQRHLQDHHPAESCKITNVRWTFIFVQHFGVIYAVIYNYTVKLWHPVLKKFEIMFLQLIQYWNCVSFWNFEKGTGFAV